MEHPYKHHEGSKLWSDLDNSLAQLAANGDLDFRTAPEYVIGYLAEHLATGGASDAERNWEAEVPYYCHSATLRIFGDAVPFDEIQLRLGLEPTSTHVRGDRPRPTSSVVFKHDMWSYQVPVPEERELDEHVLALYQVLKPHVDFLKALKSRWNVDVFCGYRSNSSTAGFEVGPLALRLFTELDIPFAVSIIVA